MEQGQQEGLLENLLRFVLVLRGLGLKVSAAEVADALEALLLVNFADRSEVYQALRYTLVKEQRGEKLFKQAFEDYFAALGEVSEQGKGSAELSFQDQPLNLTREEQAVYSRLTREQRQGLQEFLARSSEGKNVSPRFLPVIEGLVKGQLDYYRRHMGEVLPVEFTGDEKLDSMLLNISQQLPEYEELLSRDMGLFSQDDLTRVKRVINKLTRKLSHGFNRRKRQSNRAGMLDLRNSIRHSIQHGGTIFKIKYRQKRQRKPDLMLLCDISGSMERYSSFVLQFCYCLNRVFQKMDTFVFAEKLALGGPGLKNSETMEKELQLAKQECGRGTNVGRSLQELQQNFHRFLGKNKVIVVVSDAKTMESQLAAAELKKLAGKAKDIIWLNPLAKSEWERYNAVKMLRKYCRMEECSTLAQLDSAMRKALI